MGLNHSPPPNSFFRSLFGLSPSLPDTLQFLCYCVSPRFLLPRGFYSKAVPSGVNRLSPQGMANPFLFLSTCCDWHLLLIRSCPKFLIRQNICSKVILRSRLRKSDPVIVGWSRDVTHYVSLCPDLFFFIIPIGFAEKRRFTQLVNSCLLWKELRSALSYLHLEEENLVRISP